MKAIGHVRYLVRYPVNSMAGCPTESSFLGWDGLDGDLRFACRKLGDDGDFPWLTASRVGELLLYHPLGLDPTHVRTPSGAQLELRGPELQSEIAARLGSSVELMKLKHGIFDEAAVSVISLATMAGISNEAGVALDHRRFRANIVLETEEHETFLEDGWVGGTLVFGDSAAVSVTMRDLRCVMLNLDPDTGAQDKRMMKTVVRL